MLIQTYTYVIYVYFECKLFKNSYIVYILQIIIKLIVFLSIWLVALCVQNLFIFILLYNFQNKISHSIN